MQVRIGDDLHDEHRIGMDSLMPALRGKVPVATSPPDPGAFFWTYQDAVTAGAAAIVSVHISGAQSDTVRLAQQVASRVRIPVHVVDSRTTGTSLGFAALAAARVSQAGGDAAKVVAAAAEKAQRCTALFYVDTLEYLRRGGRIGSARAMIGSALGIKPILTVSEGEVAPADRARGRRRALQRLVDQAVEIAAGRPVDIAVEHFADEEAARILLAELRRELPGIREVLFTQTSATIGVHVGPATLAVTIAPA